VLVNCPSSRRYNHWILWKKEEWKIRAAFKVCQEKGIRNVGYLLRVVKRL
jgi:hypothetical protein